MNSTQDNKKWYQKKRYIFLSIFLGLITVGAFGSNSNNVGNDSVKSSVYVAPSSYQSVQTNSVSGKINTNSAQDNNLSNSNYYTNSNGNTVHSPAYSNSVPSGASARCRDGTYSFSQSRRGTCSHHGGVASWL